MLQNARNLHANKRELNTLRRKNPAFHANEPKLHGRNAVRDKRQKVGYMRFRLATGWGNVRPERLRRPSSAFSKVASFPRKRESSPYRDVDPRLRGGDNNGNFIPMGGPQTHNRADELSPCPPVEGQNGPPLQFIGRRGVAGRRRWRNCNCHGGRRRWSRTWRRSGRGSRQGGATRT